MFFDDLLQGIGGDSVQGLLLVDIKDIGYWRYKGKGRDGYSR